MKTAKIIQFYRSILERSKIELSQLKKAIERAEREVIC